MTIFYVRLNMRQSCDLKHDMRIVRRMWAVADAEANKAEFSIEAIPKSEYMSKVKLITDDWESSCKSFCAALLLKHTLVPLFVPRDHPYYGVYCDTLLTLKSRLE